MFHGGIIFCFHSLKQIEVYFALHAPLPSFPASRWMLFHWHFISSLSDIVMLLLNHFENLKKYCKWFHLTCLFLFEPIFLPVSFSLPLSVIRFPQLFLLLMTKIIKYHLLPILEACLGYISPRFSQPSHKARKTQANFRLKGKKNTLTPCDFDGLKNDFKF